MSNTVSLEQALTQLDPKNEDHWTADGAPRMDVLQELTGDPVLTRAKVNQVAANFSRENPTLALGDDPKPSGETARGTDANPNPVEEEQEEIQETDPGAETADTDAERAEIDGLGDELAEMNAELADAEEQLNKMRRAVEQKRAQRDVLVERRENRLDPQGDQKDRMAFIKRQQALRAERAGDENLAKQLALQARGIAASPLDRAMAERPRQTRVLPKSE